MYSVLKLWMLKMAGMKPLKQLIENFTITTAT